ncbi:MAG: ATP-binding protein [Verrucomicrobiota bacterium]
MRYTLLCSFGLIFLSGFLRADDWKAQISMKDPWRWTELESLDPYQISRGVLGSDGKLWFAHRGGLLSYDGREVFERVIEGFSDDRVLDFVASSDGAIYTVFRKWLAIYRDDEVTVIQSGHGNQFLENHGLVEFEKGRMIVATIGGLYELREDQLVAIENISANPSSILVDDERRLWSSEAGSSAISVYSFAEGENGLRAALLHRFSRSGPLARKATFFMDSEQAVWVLDRNKDDVCYRFVDYSPEGGVAGLQGAGLLDSDLWVAQDESGAMWFCVNRKMARFADGELEVCSFEEVPIPSSYPYAIPMEGNRLVVGGVHLNPQLLDLSTDHWITYRGLNFQCEDRSGALWFLSYDRAVVSFFRGEWKTYRTPGLIDAPNRLLVGPDQTIWASGSHQGAAAVSYLRDGEWRLQAYPQIGGTFGHLGVIRASDDTLIFGNGTARYMLGDAEGGALVVRKVNGEYLGQHFPPPTFSLRSSNIVERREEGLLFGAGAVYKGFSNGLLAAKQMDLVKNQWIDHMVVDGNDDLWLACFGVGIYRQNKDELALFGRAEGLATKKAIFLLEGPSRYGLLALTERGFFRFDGHGWSPFRSLEGIDFKRESHTVFTDRSGGIWTNFSSRAWLFENEPTKKEKSGGFRAIRYLPETNPPETFATTSSDRFPEGSQVIVQFSGSDEWNSSPARKLSYSWSMDGATWSHFSERSNATFEGLAHGAYSVWVRARDQAGNIDGSPALARFALVPPLWKRPWFIVLISVSVAGFAFLIYIIFRYRIKAAVAIEEFKMDFFTNISHEMRNPLAVIIAPVELMMSSDIDSNIRRKLNIILRNARKMQGMIDQLLQFRKIEKGMWTLNPAPGEVIGFISDAVGDFEPLWSSKSQSVELKSKTDRFFCSFDASIFRKVIDNLVSNAIKYTDEGGSIAVKLEVLSDDAKSELFLIVEDEGEGIPKHEHLNVLKPFYRLKRNRSEGGSGVGLALVQELVSLCGGSVLVESPIYGDGKGTRFSVHLPLDLTDETVFESANQQERENAIGGRNTLLIVEDNEDMRKVLAEALDKEYQIFEAEDGEKGLREAKKINPDLIVSDVMMPKQDGLAMCEKLKMDPDTSHIPIVLLTARSSMENRIEGITLGADAYIVKPLDLRHLKAQLSNLLDSRKELKQRFAKQLVVEPAEVTVTPADELILRKAIKTVEDQMLNPGFDVDRFAAMMGMSRSTLKRKLKAVTGQSPQPFVQRMRMKRAAQLLKTEGVTISQVSEMVGVYDLSYFGKLFKKEFGMTPTEYLSSKAETN